MRVLALGVLACITRCVDAPEFVDLAPSTSPSDTPYAEAIADIAEGGASCGGTSFSALPAGVGGVPGTAVGFFAGGDCPPGVEPPGVICCPGCSLRGSPRPRGFFPVCCTCSFDVSILSAIWDRFCLRRYCRSFNRGRNPLPRSDDSHGARRDGLDEGVLLWNVQNKTFLTPFPRRGFRMAGP